MLVLQYPKDKARVAKLLRRSSTSDPETEAAVRAIIEQVRTEGDRAVVELTEKFDHVSLKPKQFRVPTDRLREAWNALPKPLQEALRTAHRRIKSYHTRQLTRGFVMFDKYDNRMTQRLLPLRRAGVFVPGFTADYPSTVLMDIVPARVAGVDEIALLTPPGRLETSGGQASLGAAWLAGVDEVYAVGGTPGIAALALGTETIPRVDIIVGPGNKYIATAKRLLYGEIAIDMVAGPSEILVLADDTAEPRLVAADLLSQAEHHDDAQAMAILVGDYDVDALVAEIEVQTAASPRRQTIRRSLKTAGALIRVATVDEAVDLAEAKAPEHLEIVMRDARKIADRIRNVGAIFVGPHTPEAIGDYVAGPNHTLPTGGTARFFSPLSVWSFLKASHVVEFTQKGLEALGPDVVTIAEAEGLVGHAESVKKRLGRG
jgi:histidinol dehydrogenase